VLSGGCDAFPDGTPDVIAEEGQPHAQPLSDPDNDIVFEPFEDENGRFE